MELRAFQEVLSQRLLRWGQLNMALGMALWLSGRPFWRGFGSQAVGWGAVDAGIALLGRGANRKKEESPQANTPAALAKEAGALRRLLGINAALDVLYIVGGLRVVRSGGEKWRGHGWGIVFQGGFLLLFDLAHAWRTPLKGFLGGPRNDKSIPVTESCSRDSSEDLGMTNPSR